MHEPAKMDIWKGRVDEGNQASSLRWHQKVKPLGDESREPGLALLGVCCDEGVRRNQGRPGAAGGPDTIRGHLANLPGHDIGNLYDAGNLHCRDKALEIIQEEQREKVRSLLGQGHFPLVLGGGHEIAFGNYAGLADHLGESGEKPNIGIVNFDAHFDLRQADRPNSGTPFLQISELCRQEEIAFRYLCLGISESSNTGDLFTRADMLGVRYLKDRELHAWNMPGAENKISQFIEDCGYLYLSIDLDVLPAATAPGVSAPAAGGLPQDIVEHLLRQVTSAAGSKLRIADIAECNPQYDIDGRTARIAARICHILASNREIEANYG